jgi:hypothetical protein
MPRCPCAAGDKGGQVAFWDFVDVFQKAVLDTNAVHMWLVSALKFLPNDPDYVYTTSVDGTVQQVNIETHSVTQVANLNPGMVFNEGVDEENKNCASAHA